MAWSTTALKYGWKIVTGITLSAVTIYVAGNTRWRVNQADAIELALGVTERCLATQYQTNPVAYRVDPPTFVRSWYSNDYQTQVVAGVTSVVAVLYTNVFTNTISWRTDRAMMIELDEKIVALCPYYVDTNSVYNGSTNITMLTFTGLLTSLNLGDGTNFTAIPCFTNNVGQTNCTTNAATFGPWVWRNYITAWQERYKVLNALKMLKVPLVSSLLQGRFGANYGGSSPSSNYIDCIIASSNSWSVEMKAPAGFTAYIQSVYLKASGYFYDWWNEKRSLRYMETQAYNTNIPHSFLTLLKLNQPTGHGDAPSGMSITTFIFNAHDSGGMTNWSIVATNLDAWMGSANVSNFPIPGPEPIEGEVIYFGCDISFLQVADWQFNYCTNKYW